MNNASIPDTLLFGQEDIVEAMPMKDVVDIVEKTFADMGHGRTVNPAKLTLDLGESSPYPPYEGFMNAMPAYIGWQDIAGLKYAEDMKHLVSGDIVVCDDPQEAAVGDAVITVTQSKEPFVRKGWIAPGTVLLPMGSYQECEDDALLACGRIVVDHVQQALHRGALKELNHMGAITEANITATIGELAAGKKTCVLRPDERLLCIPIGTGAMDIAVAGEVFRRLKDNPCARRFRFVD